MWVECHDLQIRLIARSSDEDLDTDKYLSNDEYDPDLNQYHVKASQSIEEWEKAGQSL